jgi:acetoin utilization deacetylase AcuC-like enzyme
MKIIHSEQHRGHAGAKEMRYDRMIPMSESPERIDMILDALSGAGFDAAVAPQSFGLEPVLAVHDRRFVDFLQTAYDLWETELGPGGFATAYMFGMRGMAQEPNKSVHSMLACYTFDVCVPMVAGTWTAIESSVDVALSGTHELLQGSRSVFSLCRPPGHHASRDLAGGYCYLNNAAIAAQAYRDAGVERVAILDVDYHHGNGTQRIFYERDDVLFVSLHARPEDEYPFLIGYAREAGAGPGEGFNVNLPLPTGTAWNHYERALQTAVDHVRAYRPDVLILSLGVDTYRDDPVGGFALDSDDYARLGETIGAMQLPTHIVMEGGYAMSALGDNVANVLRAFESTHA